MTGPARRMEAKHWVKKLGFSCSQFRIDSKTVALVTGGSNGLGLEIVKLLVQKTATVIIADITAPEYDFKTSKNIFFYKCDVSNKSDVDALYFKISLTHGKVSFLINNAGTTYINELKTSSSQQIEKIITVNLLGTFLITKTFFKDLISNENSYIVNIASILGMISPARLTAYGASKGGMISFHRCLNKLLKYHLYDCHLKIMLVCPGKINTTMFAKVKTPSQLMAPDLNPEHLASLIIQNVENKSPHNLKIPYYTNLVPIFNMLDWPYIWLFKRLSRMNNATNI